MYLVTIICVVRQVVLATRSLGIYFIVLNLQGGVGRWWESRCNTKLVDVFYALSNYVELITLSTWVSLYPIERPWHLHWDLRLKVTNDQPNREPSIIISLDKYWEIREWIKSDWNDLHKAWIWFKAFSANCLNFSYSEEITKIYMSTLYEQCIFGERITTNRQREMWIKSAWMLSCGHNHTKQKQ